MALTVLLLIGLAAVLGPSAGQQPGIASVSTDRPDQQKEITGVHNEFRRNVKPSASNMLKMKWDPIAADSAKLWAQECTFDHSPPEKKQVNGKRCGENIFMSAALSPWSKAIQSWHSEEKHFMYGTGSRTGAIVGHYTQLVWYRSSQIGCAVARCPRADYTYYYVCHYCPAGNNVRSINTPYKSGSSCADCPNACDNNLCTNPCPHTNKFGNCPDLKRYTGCDNPQVKEWCPASCQCTNEII